MAKQLPLWIKKRFSFNEELLYTLALIETTGLNTVCQSAHCPNLGECFSRKTATFMILGRICTRNCAFCAVEHGSASEVDPEEPVKIALAVQSLGLKHVVLTSVTRDDLPDGGASHFASSITAIRLHNPSVTVEVLTPDFLGMEKSIAAVVRAMPNIYNHNLETVPRLYHQIRAQADYQRSLALLEQVKLNSKSIYTKSGIMVGLGEKYSEVIETMRDLRSIGCDMLTIGQYLQPSSSLLEVKSYVDPEIFEEYRLEGLEAGFIHVASAPLVRSSYAADDYFKHS